MNAQLHDHNSKNKSTSDSVSPIDVLRKMLLKYISRTIKKLRRRMQNINNDMRDAENADTLKRHGELIKSMLSSITPGQKSLTVTDYSCIPPKTITLPLDEKKDPANIMNEYFTRYKKLRRKAAAAQKRARETQAELEEWEKRKRLCSVTENIETLHTLKQNIFPESLKIKKKDTPFSGIGKRYRINDALIIVGRNDLENDIISKRLGRGNDWWFHAHNYPGSHVLVILSKSELAAEQLHAAAMLAGWNSKVKSAGHGEIVYTRKKYLTRPRGTPPGTITFSKSKTIHITFTADDIKQLEKHRIH